MAKDVDGGNARGARIDTLVFIYNADGGLLNGIMDSVHKTVSPATYSCSLCAMTYGVFAMSAKWREWLKALPVATEFYHRDDSPFGALALPAVLARRGSDVETLLTADKLGGLRDVDALIAALDRYLGADRTQSAR